MKIKIQNDSNIAPVLGVLGGLLPALLLSVGCTAERFASASTQTQTAAGVAPAIPTRVNRALLEKNLKAKVSLYPDTQSEDGTFIGSVRMVQYPTEEPAPTRPYLADFRDYKQCAEFQGEGLDGFSSCFMVSPDVSSIDLTAKKVSLQGLETLLSRAAPSGCNLVLQRSDWQGAQKDDSGFSLEYRLVVSDPNGCLFGPEQGNHGLLTLKVRIEAV